MEGLCFPDGLNGQVETNATSRMLCAHEIDLFGLVLMPPIIRIVLNKRLLARLLLHVIENELLYKFLYIQYTL